MVIIIVRSIVTVRVSAGEGDGYSSGNELIRWHMFPESKVT